jgi:hypothetical protein
MKSLSLWLLVFMAGVSHASSISVKTPLENSRVTSPFQLVATAAQCGSVPAVSMGYSIDSGPTTIVPTSFSATLSADNGRHTLHVKCWGKKAHEDLSVGVTVIPVPPPPASATPAFLPAAGSYSSAQSVTLTAATPGATIYYTTDGSGPTSTSNLYAGPISVTTSEVIEAVAMAPGHSSSGLGRANYVIAAAQSGPVIPSTALAAANLQQLDTWKFDHDPGTPGSADGETGLVGTPSVSGNARQFVSSYTGAGGEIYHVSFGKDTTATNFVYDGWVFIADGSSIANLEMDMNQVTANGDTVIYGFQCDGYSGTWDYTGILNGNAHWYHSAAPCKVSEWPTEVWHHVQVAYSRDTEGNVTYSSVWLDGKEAIINATVPSAFALGWGQTLLTNFQVDGVGEAGSSTVYLDNFAVYRW